MSYIIQILIKLSTLALCVGQRMDTTAAPTCHPRAVARSRLNYCNSVLFGISGSSLRNVQNAVARLVTDSELRQNITPVFIGYDSVLNFKLAALVYKALNGRLRSQQ